MAEVNKQLQAWAKQSREKEQQIRRDMQKGTWKPNAVSAAPKVTVNRDPKPVKYVGAKAASGLLGGIANAETAGRITTEGLMEEKARTRRVREAVEKAAKAHYDNPLLQSLATLAGIGGYTVARPWLSTLRQAQDINKKTEGMPRGEALRKSLPALAGGAIDATMQAQFFANPLLEPSMTMLDRTVARRNGLSVEEQEVLNQQLMSNGNVARDVLPVDELQAYTERQKPLQNKVVRGAGEVAEVVGAMAPALAVGAATKNPVAAKMLMSGQVMGGKAEEALANGATLDEARRAGLLSGAVAYGTESLFRGIPLIDRNTGLAVSAAKKVLPKTVVTALENYGKTQAGRNLVWVANKGGEGVEEVIEDLLDPAISSIYGDDKTITAKQLIQDFGLGTVVSLILGGAPGKVQNTTEAETVAEAPAELKTEPQKPITREEYAAAVKQFHAEMEQNSQQEADRNAAGQTEDTKAPNVLLRGNAEQQTARPQGPSAPEILYGDRYGNLREPPDEPLLLGTAEESTQTFDEWLNQKLKTETDPVERYRLTMLRDYAENEFLSAMGENATADTRQANIQTPGAEGEIPLSGMEEYPADATNAEAWREYVTDEAKTHYASDPRFQGWAHPELAYITAAAWDGKTIPFDYLQSIPELAEAQKRATNTTTSLKLHPDGSDPMIDQKRAELSEKLRDQEHGSAVLSEKGKIVKRNGQDDFSGPVAREGKAYIVIGRPAGGKSSVFANRLSGENQARIMDSDTVKPWLDGYDEGYGAGFVQDESDLIMKRALKHSLALGENVVIPKIGGANSIKKIIAELRNAGYNHISLYFNEVSEESSLMRAASRFAQEGRYLNLGYLKSIGDKPLNGFYELADSGLVDYAEWRNNDVGFGEEPILKWKTGDGPVTAVRRGNTSIDRQRGQLDGRLGSGGESVREGSEKVPLAVQGQRISASDNGQGAFSVPIGSGPERTRGLMANSIPNAAAAGTISEAAAEAATKSEGATYRPVTMDQSRQAGIDAINAMGGLENTFRALISKKGNAGFNSTEMAAAIEYAKATSEANPSDAADLLVKIAESGTDIGRAMNYLKALSRSTPEGLLLSAQKQLKSISEKSGLEQKLTLSDQDAKDILALGRLIQGTDKADPAQRSALIEKQKQGMSKALAQDVDTVMQRSKPGEEADWLCMLEQRIVAEKVPGTVVDRFRAMQRINLLFNIKTQVRNFGGNALHGLAESTSDAAATPADILLSKITGFRTVGLPNFRDYIQGFSEGVRDATTAYKTGTIGQMENRYTDNNRQLVAKNFRHMFKGETVPGRVMNWFADAGNWLDETTSYIMTAGDLGFRKGRTAMTEKAINRLNGGRADFASEIAGSVGRTATFQEDTALAKGMIGLRNLPGNAVRTVNGGQDSAAAKAADVLAYGVNPFAKTPANLLTQVVRYSPAGLLNGVTKVANTAYRAKTGKKVTPEMQRKAVDALGRGIVGSGLMGLGYFLAAFGKASGEADDDRDKAAFDKSAGKLPNAIKFGDYYVDLSSMAPIPVAINLGASIYNSFREAGFDGPQAAQMAYTILSAPISDVTGDSLWQGMSKFVSTAFEDKDPVGAVTQALGSMAQQMVPFQSFLRGIAGLIDPYKRDTSSDTKAGQYVNSIVANLPGLSETLPPKVDTSGDKVRRSEAETFAGRAVDILLNPGTSARDNTDEPLYQMLNDIYEDTGRKDVFPQIAPYRVSQDGVEYSVTGEERSRFQEKEGKSAADILLEMANDRKFRAMDTDAQADAITEALTYSKDKAKNDLLKTVGVSVEPTSTMEAIETLSGKGIPLSAIMVTRSVKGENDQKADGTTISNSNNAKVVKTISAMDLPDEQKIELSEVYAGKTTTKALQAAMDIGINVDQAMDAWVDISNAEAGDGYETTAQALAIYHSDLPADQKKAYSDAILVRSSFGKETPTDIDYSSEETVIITSLSATAQHKWPVAKGWNMTPEQYGRFVKACNSQSKKADQIAALETVFREEYGDRIDAAAWAQKFRALMETKAYGV